MESWRKMKTKKKALESKLSACEHKLEAMKNFWKPIIDKFETKYPNAGNANTMALTALTEAFDIHCKNEELEQKLAVAIKALEEIGTELYGRPTDMMIVARKAIKQIKGEG